jgi:hypothetical protein
VRAIISRDWCLWAEVESLYHEDDDFFADLLMISRETIGVGGKVYAMLCYHGRDEADIDKVSIGRPQPTKTTHRQHLLTTTTIHQWPLIEVSDPFNFSHHFQAAHLEFPSAIQLSCTRLQNTAHSAADIGIHYQKSDCSSS